MALKNVNIPLNIQDYPNTNNNSSSTYIGVNSLLNNSSDNQNLVTITNYLPSDQSSVNISKMINGIIVGPTTTLSNIQNSIIVGSINTSSSSLAGSQVGVSNILAAGSYLEIPNASNCTILGVGNNPDVQNPLFIIGNGSTYSSNHNIVEVTTDSVHISPSRSNAVTVDITGTGVNITGATTITGGATISGLLTIGDEDNGTTTIEMNEITTSSLYTNSIKVRSGDSISIESPVNLNNNTISGGATLNGTYTFDAENGLKIGNKTIQSSGAGTLTLPRGSGTLAKTFSLYWVDFNIDWKTRYDTREVNAAFSVNGKGYSEFIATNVVGDVYGYFLSTVQIHNNDQVEFTAGVSGCVQTFTYNEDTGQYPPLHSYNLYHAYTGSVDSVWYLYLIGGAYYAEPESGYQWHSIKLQIELNSVSFNNTQFNIGS